jgi:HEPN domain-containing protein
MNPITAEWVAKAEGDFATAKREFGARKNPNHDAVCFHAQQCAEKYLKARLQEAGIPFGKTHDLPTLLNLTLAVEQTWTSLLTDMQTLSIYAVAYRYPGDSADKKDAKKALEACENFRAIARQSLGL